MSYKVPGAWQKMVDCGVVVGSKRKCCRNNAQRRSLAWMDGKFYGLNF